MKEVSFTNAEITDIHVPDRLRLLDNSWVDALAVSIGEQGLQQPVVVRVGSKKGAQYELLAGAHRFAACKQLGLVEIPARVVSASDLEARLIEIDENLIRHELNPLDRAAFLSERKLIWEGMYPETRHGAQGGRAGKKNENESFSFSKATAERIGVSRRTIEIAVRIQARLAPEVRRRLAGTFLAEKQSDLVALARLDPTKQSEILDLVLAEDTPVRSVAAAVRHLGGGTVLTDEDRQLQRLLDSWNRASRKPRNAFLSHLRETGVIAEKTGPATGRRKAAD